MLCDGKGVGHRQKGLAGVAASHLCRRVASANVRVVLVIGAVSNGWRVTVEDVRVRVVAGGEGLCSGTSALSSTLRDSMGIWLSCAVLSFVGLNMLLHFGRGVEWGM